MHNGCFLYETQNPEGFTSWRRSHVCSDHLSHCAFDDRFEHHLLGIFREQLKGTKNYRFELYYWDYGLGIFLISLVLAFTMGSYAGGPDAFLANLHSADAINLFYAALGGFILTSRMCY